MNIQQPTTSEVANTETSMAYNEDLDPPPPQDILNVFAAADFSSCSSSDSSKDIPACLKSKLIRSSILSAGGFPDACNRALSISLNHKEIASIMAVTGAILQKRYANVISGLKEKKTYCTMHICQ